MFSTGLRTPAGVFVVSLRSSVATVFPAEGMGAELVIHGGETC